MTRSLARTGLLFIFFYAGRDLMRGTGHALREETEYRPKPMVHIGGRPILWHIMKHYARYGHREFILCLGYKGEIIKDYFHNYHWNTSDVTLKLGTLPQVVYHSNHDEEDWLVTMVDTGDATQTGGRLKRVLKYIRDDEFFLTYGDGVSNINLDSLVAYHREKKVRATLTAVPIGGRFGELGIVEGKVRSFHEKPPGQGLISGGFFVLHKSVAELLPGDACVFERDPLQALAQRNELAAYKHDGFWQCMDTYRETVLLNEMWASGNPPWKTW